MKISAIKRDSKAIEQGQWIDNIPELEGIRLKVRGGQNSDARALSDKLIQSIPRDRRIKGLSPDDQDRVTAKVMVECILLDWEGFQNDDGTPFEYSKAAAESLLMNPDFTKFREAVQFASMQVGEIVAANIADDAKN